MKEQSRTKQFK